MSVYVQFDIEGRFSLSSLTEGWSDEEIDALMAGDVAAKDAVVMEAQRRALAEGVTDFPVHSEVHLFDFRKAQA